jgi:FkbM family methyltransferase
MVSLKRIAGLAKPEYLLRPQQIPRKLWRETADDQRLGVRTARLPWGLDIDVNISESIGWSVYTRGIYETEVTETLWRLAAPGDTVVDGGANVGYMTSVLAVRVGPRGSVHCFEPHPDVFRDLERNVGRWRNSRKCGSFVLHDAALGERQALATLRAPSYFPTNRGTSWIDSGEENGEGDTIKVQVLALDDVFPSYKIIGVVKLDVEGYGLRALKGMQRMLHERRIRHIIFEELDAFPAATHHFLHELGYRTFGLERKLRGVRCVPERQPRYDPINSPSPNYLATADPEFVVSRVQRGIWKSFGPAHRLSRW